MIEKEGLLTSNDLLEKALKKFQSNDLSGAVALYEEILRQEPENFYALNNLAIIFLRLGRDDVSRNYARHAALNKLENVKPSEVINFAAFLSRLQEHELSLEVLEKEILRNRAENSQEEYIMLFNAGMAARKLEKHDKLLNFLHRAEKIERKPDLLAYLGEAYKNVFKTKEAFNYINETIKLGCDNASIRAVLGEIYVFLGQEDKAYECFLESIKMDESYVAAYLGLSSIGKLASENKYLIPKLESLAAMESLYFDDRCLAYYTLGRAYDKLKEYDKAFLNYKRANDLWATRIKDYGYDLLLSTGKRNFNVFTKDFIHKKKDLRNQSQVPIFIFGMPRSGTTLTGQILSSHSEVISIGEKDCIISVDSEVKSRKVPGGFGEVNLPELVKFMNEEEIVNLGDMYLKKATEGIDGKFKIVNSVPTRVNNLGFVAYIFPNAKIVHCKRHPLDTCLSIYFQNFISVDYSCNMEAIILFYKHYDATMKYWHNQIPGRIYDNYYEELLLNQEEKSRDLIKNCGLPWEDNCLQFHKKKGEVFTASSWQVRQQIYTSSMFRFKNYEKFLEPLKSALAEEITEYESQLEKRLNQS